MDSTGAGIREKEASESKPRFILTIEEDSEDETESLSPLVNDYAPSAIEESHGVEVDSKQDAKGFVTSAAGESSVQAQENNEVNEPASMDASAGLKSTHLNKTKNQNKVDASEISSSEAEMSDQEDLDREERQRSSSKKLAKDEATVARILKRVSDLKCENLEPRKVVFGKPWKGGRGVQIRVDDYHIPAKEIHFEAGASLNAIRALTRNCRNADQQTDVINKILQADGCKVRVRNANFCKPEQSNGECFGTIEIFRTQGLHFKLSHLKEKSMATTNIQQVERIKRRRLNKGASGASSAQIAAQITSSRNCGGDDTASLNPSGRDSATSSEATQSNTIEEVANAKQRFAFLYAMAPSDVKLQLLKESLEKLQDFS